MSTVPAKQIIKVLSAPIRVSGFSATGGSSTVTTAITTALSTAGAGGVSVPLQASASEGLGVVTTGTNNRVEVYNATTKEKISNSSGREVYGRLTEASGVYTLTYFTLSAAGAETAYSHPSSTSIDFEFNYRFDFARFPTDGAIAITARNISNDPATGSGTIQREQLTPTALNTLPAISKVPTSAASLTLTVNGVEYDTFGGAAAVVAVNTSTRAVTWSSANAGFNLETTDRVIAEYRTFE